MDPSKKDALKLFEFISRLVAWLRPAADAQAQEIWRAALSAALARAWRRRDLAELVRILKHDLSPPRLMPGMGELRSPAPGGGAPSVMLRFRLKSLLFLIISALFVVLLVFILMGNTLPITAASDAPASHFANGVALSSGQGMHFRRVPEPSNRQGGYAPLPSPAPSDHIAAPIMRTPVPTLTQIKPTPTRITSPSVPTESTALPLIAVTPSLPSATPMAVTIQTEPTPTLTNTDRSNSPQPPIVSPTQMPSPTSTPTSAATRTCLERSAFVQAPMADARDEIADRCDAWGAPQRNQPLVRIVLGAVAALHASLINYTMHCDNGGSR